MPPTESDRKHCSTIYWLPNVLTHFGVFCLLIIRYFINGSTFAQLRLEKWKYAVKHFSKDQL